MPARRDLLSVLVPLTRELRRIEDAAAGVDHLTMWQYAVLATIERAPANQTSVAAQLRYSKNRLVHDIDHLERLGLVTRVVQRTDRRSNLVTITSDGRSVRSRIQKRIHVGEDKLMPHVSTASRAQFLSLAAEISDGMRPPS